MSYTFVRGVILNDLELHPYRIHTYQRILNGDREKESISQDGTLLTDGL